MNLERFSTYSKPLGTSQRQQYLVRLETIYQHASEISRTDSLKEVARVTLDWIKETFSIGKSSFSQIHEDVLTPVEVRGDVPPLRNEIPLDGDGIIAKVARTGLTINISDVRD